MRTKDKSISIHVYIKSWSTDAPEEPHSQTSFWTFLKRISGGTGIVQLRIKGLIREIIRFVQGVYRDHARLEDSTPKMENQMSSVVLVVEPGKIISLIIRYYSPKGAHDLILHWVP